MAKFELKRNERTEQSVSSVSDELKRARTLATSKGRFEQALAAYREAIAHGQADPKVLLEYARFLVTHSKGGAAEEVLAQLLARDGSRIDALELYLELVRELELSSRRVSWALARLSDSIAANPGAHRAALDYAIPYKLKTVLAAIASDSDPVSQAAVQINAAYDEKRVTDEFLQSFQPTLKPNDLMRAHLTVLLARGNRDVATRLLAEADVRAVPMNALRRAIRRARAGGHDQRAIQYLDAYLRIQPEDAWARGLRAGYRRDADSNAKLLRTGYPFPPLSATTSYSPENDHVFYLLHNSLPHHSAGYATRTHGLLSELNRSGWVVDGVTRLGYPYDMPGKATIPDVPIAETIGDVTYRRLLQSREIEKKNPLLPYTERYGSSLRELSMKLRPALLHAASNHWNGLTAVRTARELGIPSIYEVRGLWEVTRASRDPEWTRGSGYQFMARMETEAAMGATRVLTITRALKEELVARGVDEGKIEIVPNGVDTERFVPMRRDEQLAADLGVTGKTVIGYVGSVLDYEGIDLIISAAADLARSRDDFHVLIVGDGSELERLRALVEGLSLESVITFTGRVPHEEVERYYSVIDIAPFPRLPLPVCEMVSPLKPFEAMAMGKAVVAANVNALAEFVIPGTNGFLHQKGDAGSLRLELEQLLDDRELVERTGTLARDWVVENRDWRVLAQTISRTYGELLG
ncbi:glycosyltransferase [Agrococcus sp. Marseille-P2731]|uniref:glycosyltransferase n=1 Tax=Agrococcus sp. Marseille-P2731 TaxID=1841862 RepID=UPI000930B8A6|nr:glycosyltransferase [Agrococcus sp. Marseille-P2731]